MDVRGGLPVEPDHALKSETRIPVYLYTSTRVPRVRVGSRPTDDSAGQHELYEVRIIDNDHNTYGEVMEISMLALGVTEEQAFAIAWEVDHRGSCVVAEGPYEEAETVARVIRVIGIEVQVNRLGVS